MQELSECQLVLPVDKGSRQLQKVEEEKSSEVFGTENSSDYLSMPDQETDQEQNWAETVKVVFQWQWSWMTDALLALCEGLYYVLLNILLVPVAILGLFFDKLRHCLRKVSDDVALLQILSVLQNSTSDAKDKSSQPKTSHSRPRGKCRCRSCSTWTRPWCSAPNSALRSASSRRAGTT